MHTLNLRSFLWFTTGVALTLTTIATFTTLRASAAVTSGESTFVPITPCRLFDTRPAPDNVGKRVGPVAQTPFVAQVTGTNGNCTIPSDATAVAMNLTAVNPTASSFVQVYPADVSRPTEGSNLNVTAGQAPVPNKVDVKLSTTGRIAVYNNSGTVDAVADIVGYYKASTVAALESRLAAAEAKITSLLTDTNAIPSGVTVTGEIIISGPIDDSVPFAIGTLELPGDMAAGYTVASGSDVPGNSAVPECSGTASAPTAAAGHLCLYGNGGDANVGEIAVAPSEPDPLRRLLVLALPTSNPGSVGVIIAWAYTAP